MQSCNQVIEKGNEKRGRSIQWGNQQSLKCLNVETDRVTHVRWFEYGAYQYDVL